eukprot:11177694-Lingulodinium_polyedra.AAC.1
MTGGVAVAALRRCWPAAVPRRSSRSLAALCLKPLTAAGVSGRSAAFGAGASFASGGERLPSGWLRPSSASSSSSRRCPRPH